jgi:hypothetical protein
VDRLFDIGLMLLGVVTLAIVAGINRRQRIQMTLARDVLDRVKKIGPAIDKFEAKVTELLKDRLSEQEKADLEEAKAELDRAFSDAEDGVDEADTGTGGGEPTEPLDPPADSETLRHR